MTYPTESDADRVHKQLAAYRESSHELSLCASTPTKTRHLQGGSTPLVGAVVERHRVRLDRGLEPPGGLSVQPLQRRDTDSGNGEKVHVAFSLDCCDREVIGWVAANSHLDGSDVRDLIALSVDARFGGPKAPKPLDWLTDNGPPYVANDTRSFAWQCNLKPRNSKCSPCPA